MKRKKYLVCNMGCDDSNWFFINLTDNELNLVVRLFRANNRRARNFCNPVLNIFPYDFKKKSIFDYDIKTSLNC